MAPVKKAKDHTTHLQHPIRVAAVIVDATLGGMLRVLVRDGGGWDYDLGGGLTEVQTDKTASFELAARKHAGIDYPHLNRTGTQMRLRIWKVKQKRQIRGLWRGGGQILRQRQDFPTSCCVPESWGLRPCQRMPLPVVLYQGELALQHGGKLPEVISIGRSGAPTPKRTGAPTRNMHKGEGKECSEQPCPKFRSFGLINEFHPLNYFGNRKLRKVLHQM